MGRERITEFHYISPLVNLVSIFDKGILSHNDAEGVKSADVSMQEVQDRRANKIIPAEAAGTPKKIHDCANVYFNARNPMLYKRRGVKQNICVLRLKPALVDLPEAIIADRNAAADKANFFKAAEGIGHLAEKVLFDKDSWYSDNKEQTHTDGQLRCAELLIPHTIHPSYIGGMYVASEEVKQAVAALFPEGCPVAITVHPAFFFERAIKPLIPSLENSRFPNPIDFVQEPSAPIAPIERKIDVLAPAAAPQKKVIEFDLRKSLPPHITLKKGNLLASSMQTLVNTVNCKGTMGAGIAKEFKTHHKKMFADYKRRCDENKVKPGIPYLYEEEGKKIINFPTKDHWKDKSKISWINQGLAILKNDLEKWGITSLAIPALGCGHGGLDWPIVRKQIIATFQDLPHITVEIYEP